ncbi:DNA recombination protein RmuC [Sphingomonas mucosissima]|uniref:DNA recombination protein RmuC homolog n=1 Tax=Sphingomonas mucosissima TaxID=370959 RepID=A0A245ZFM6_9SPHN|nr:DNA recombination protein RmuC [Sphingomonas mucosissima]OWK28546.1 DNA recombination protein RmuC [Sphingomonas mucosissima]
MEPIAAVFVIVALLLGLAVGWWLAQRSVAAIRAERDARAEEFKRAIVDLAGAEERAKAADGLRRELGELRADRDAARGDVARLEAEARGFDARLTELREAKDALSAQFSQVGQKLLTEAQDRFLQRANERFRESEEVAGANLRAMLQPVSERLQRYEEGVHKVEAERRDAFGELRGQIEQMRLGQESVRSEAAKLVNALRNAPKARGRWGEQQLRNVLESCGLSEHADFATEVSVTDAEGARFRPDVIVRIPGGKSLVIDAKVSLNAYQDAFGAVDEVERAAGLTAHAAAMRAHVNGLGAKAYWNQFDDAPDYVIMFVPGEHFLSAALEHDSGLWDYAFERRVLLATPTNLIAIARTVAAVWRQELLAEQAREIAQLGKDLYARLSVMGGHVAKLGKNLDTAMSAYNQFVGSLESQVLTQARRFEALKIDTAGKSIEAPPVSEQSARPVTKLITSEAAE